MTYITNNYITLLLLASLTVLLIANRRIKVDGLQSVRDTPDFEQLVTNIAYRGIRQKIWSYPDPENIIKMMTSEIEDKSKYEVVIDRKEAIDKALSIANKNDIILIAGKGRDNYMAIKDKYEPYCDLDVIEDYFK